MAKDDLFSRIGQAARSRVQKARQSIRASDNKYDDALLGTADFAGGIVGSVANDVNNVRKGLSSGFAKAPAAFAAKNVAQQNLRRAQEGRRQLAPNFVRQSSNIFDPVGVSQGYKASNLNDLGNVARGTGSGMKLALLGKGLRNPGQALKFSTTSGLLGGGLALGSNKLFGTDYNVPQEAGKAFAQGPIYSAINPGTQALGATFLGGKQLGNPAAQNLLQRGAGGLAEVFEDNALTAMSETRLSNPVENLTSFIVGSVFGKANPGDVIDSKKISQAFGRLRDPNSGQFIKRAEQTAKKLNSSLKGKYLSEVDLKSQGKWTEVSPGKYKVESPGEAAGLVAGFEYEVDEEGRITNVTYNPTKGVAGLAVMGGLKTKPGRELINKLQIKPQDRSKLQLKPDGTIDRTKLSAEQLSKPNEVLEKAYKQIGSIADEKRKPLKQIASDLYTQWVDRYNPLNQAADFASKQLKKQGAELRPEFNPKYLVRRLTGASGIADYRYQNQLKPIIDTMEQSNIDKLDMDVYLKARRDIGLSERGIKGSDAKQAQEIISNIEAKYGDQINNIADQLYKYQNKGFQEMIDAGFLSKEAGDLIRQQNPDYVPFQRVMDEVENYLGLPTRKTQQGSQPILKIKGSDKKIYSPVEEIIANTFKQRAAIEKNRVAKSLVELQKVAPDLGFNKVSKSGSDTITVWNDGKKEYWKVGESIAETAKGLNEENMNTLLKIFTAPASLLRQGATGKNPDFMLPNIVRDQLDAAITSKYGYIPFVDYISGLKSIINKDDIFQKWESSGAKIDLGEMSGRKSVKQSFDKTQKKRSLIKWLNQGLETLGKYSEQPTRVGLFKKAYNKTGNELLSTMESRDATVDFSRMGSKMKVANSIVPFLNVGVQGFDKLIRSFKNDPAKVSLTMGAYAALPQITTTLYNLLNHREEYTEIPQYVKDSNFVLINGRNEDGTVSYTTIPKGNVLPVVANPIENFLSYLAGADQQTFSEFATQFTSSMLPVVGDGSTLKEVGIKTIGQNLPQLIKPATENLINKSFWKYDQDKEQAKDIVPYFLQDKPPAERTYEFTPAMYQAIGRAINTSPLQVKNFMEGYLAGFVKTPSNIMDALVNISKGEDIDKNQIPIVRRFVANTYPSSSSDKPKVNNARVPLFEQAQAADEQAALPTNQEELKSLYERDLKTIEGYTDKKINTQYKEYDDEDDRQKQLDRIESQYNEALSRQSQFNNQYPELVGEAEYVSKAKLNLDERKELIKQELRDVYSSESPKPIFDYLAENQRKVNGERLVTVPVINDLYKEGVINKYERDLLKSVSFTKDGQIKFKLPTKATGKSKKRKVFTFKPGKINYSRLQIKAPQLPRLRTQIATPSLNTPRLPRVKLAPITT